MDEPEQPKHPLDIPEFLLRDPVTKRAPFMSDVEVAEVEKVEKAKPVKKTAKPKVEAKKPAKKAAAKAPVKAKAAKPKAVKKAAAEKDQYGLRKGSARSEAASMYARKNGATLAEVKERIGSVQLNVLNALKADGYAVTQEKITKKGERPVTRYYLKPKA